MKIRCAMCGTVSDHQDEVVYEMRDVRCPGCNVTLIVLIVPRGVGRNEMPALRDHAPPQHYTGEQLE